jgi:L-rhamnose isomerase
MIKKESIQKAYEMARERYAETGIDSDAVLKNLDRTAISMHCWQADDVSGFENPDAGLSGGIQATGNYPGKAATLEQIRQDYEKVMSLLPGKQRLSLHAIYGDFRQGKADRDKIEPGHFTSWVEWAKKQDIGLDFNCTLFSHPKTASGYTLSDNDPSIREFWIEHVRKCRDIAAYMGRELGSRCVHNIWIPDGSKDLTVSRFKHRSHLKDSLDKILAKKQDPRHMADAIEAKLFGIGVEAYTVGSHEFYLGYAVKNNMMLCLDIGHFHPTEQVSDKVSAVFQFIPELLFHVTRPIRWDSDHVVILTDEIRALFEEIVWADKLDKVNIGLDFFDASINRIGAYVTGVRAAQKAILLALLNPTAKLREYDDRGQHFERLALLEETKSMPFGAVWDFYCLSQDVPAGQDYIPVVQQYEKDILSKR